MPIKIVRNDLTKMECDAIVNATNTGLRGGGGVSEAVHKAAGPLLDEACRKFGGCGVGQARAVKLADLRHNSDISRLETVDDKALRRVQKYKEAIALLEN